MDTAKKISENSGLSLMLTKQAVNRALGMSIEDTLVMENRDLQVIMGSSEQQQRTREAMERLRAKREEK